MLIRINKNQPITKEKELIINVFFTVDLERVCYKSLSKEIP